VHATLPWTDLDEDDELPPAHILVPAAAEREAKEGTGEPRHHRGYRRVRGEGSEAARPGRRLLLRRWTCGRAAAPL